MSFRGCIQNWSDIGRLSESKKDEAFATFDRAYERAVADGLDGIAAEAHAAGKALEEITTLTSERRWQRINEMQRSYELNKRIMASDNPVRELEHIMEEVEDNYRGISAQLMGGLDSYIQRYMPKKAGLHNPVDGLDDIVYAGYGVSRTPEAKIHADAILEASEMGRKWANMHGASIPENPNRRFPQTQERARVNSVTEEVYVNDHLREGVVDWDIVKYAGKVIAPENRAEILARMYQGIISDGADRGNLGQQTSPNLAGRLNRERFIYYKTPEAYIEMQKKYGSGSLFEQTIGMVDAMAKDISLLKTFGPSTDTGKEFTKRIAETRAAQIDAALPPGKRTHLDKLRRELVVFDDMYKIHARHVITTEGNLSAQAVGVVRQGAVNAYLGGIFIPSLLGDLNNAKAARAMFNLPAAKVYRNYFKNFVMTTKNRREITRGMVVLENGISMALQRQRYFGAMAGPYWMRRYSDITYRLGITSHHTQVIRDSEAQMFMGFLADNVNTKFDDLPFAAAFSERGITPFDWDRFRQTPPKEVKGATFLRPSDLWATAADDAERKIAEKFMNVLQLYGRTMVPDTTLRSRRAMGEAIDPNSAWGLFIRSAGSLMSFPVSIHFNQLRRISEAATLGKQFELGAKYFAWMTVGGMAITQIKALSTGKHAYDMFPTDEDGTFAWERAADFYGRSIVNGGSFGILGDLIFNNLNMNNSKYRGGNPSLEYLKSFHKLTIDNIFDAAAGRKLDFVKDALDFARANVPNFWYSKLLFDRALGDELMQQTDPAGYKMKKKYLKEHEEGMWWEPD